MLAELSLKRLIAGGWALLIWLVLINMVQPGQGFMTAILSGLLAWLFKEFATED